MSDYFRPLVQGGPARPDDAQTLAGGWTWFTHAEVLSRGAAPRIIPAAEMPQDRLAALTAPRPDISGASMNMSMNLSMDRPRVMGILNATPDSFSDGGLHAAAEDAIAAGRRMVAEGVDVLDIGGESTRPGAETVAPSEETRRILPVIAGLRDAGALISVDTRKTSVARAAVEAGAGLINDVSGFLYDPDLADYAAEVALPVCVMHSQGAPETMQRDPRYGHVLLDVYDFLADRIAALEAAGIARANIIADPGIGFGKRLDHNLALLARISLFHGLGVPILLGASRKRFIGTLGNAPEAETRAPGSIAVGLAGISQGVQMLRVHDTGDTLQAMALWRAAGTGQTDE